MPGANNQELMSHQQDQTKCITNLKFIKVATGNKASEVRV